MCLFISNVWRRLRGGLCHSRVSLSVPLSDFRCDWSEFEITNSSFRSASNSVPPLATVPWRAFLSSFLSWRLRRMKPGMQMTKEKDRRLSVRPRYAILKNKHILDCKLCFFDSGERMSGGANKVDLFWKHEVLYKHSGWLMDTAVTRMLTVMMMMMMQNQEKKQHTTSPFCCCIPTKQVTQLL